MLCLALAPVRLLAQPSFLVMTEELPPFNFTENGKVTGISTEIVRSVFSAAGYGMTHGDVQVYPWARAYHDVMTIPDSILYSMGRTAEREDLVRWVGPLLNVTIGAVARKDRHIQVDSIEDLKQYRIGTLREGAPEQLLISKGVPLENLERLSQPMLNIRKLEEGRIDLYVFNTQTVQYLMASNGINPDDYESVYTLKEIGLYLGLHKNTPDDVVDKLQSCLDAMKEPAADGMSPLQRIIDKYLKINPPE